MEPMKDSGQFAKDLFQSAAYIAMLPFWLALEAMEADYGNQTGIDKSREDWAVNGLRSLYGERDATRYYVAGSTTGSSQERTARRIG